MMTSHVDASTSAYRGKRVLVTGATGFVGGHLLHALAGGSAEAAVLTRSSGPVANADRTYTGNLSDKDFVRAAMQDWAPHVVFHLASARERNLTREAFDAAIEANLCGTLNLLYAGVGQAQLERVVVLGTGEEYGRNSAPFDESMREAPISAYSFSKQCATQLSQLMHSSFGLPAVVLRPSVAYGPGQDSDMFLPALIESVLRGEEFKMTLGEQTRDYVYVVDLVDALLRSGTCANLDGEIINIGSGRATRIAQLVDRVEALLGRGGLVRRGALAYRTGEPMEYLLDVAKAEKLLQWNARTPLEVGLRCTVDWYKERNT